MTARSAESIASVLLSVESRAATGSEAARRELRALILEVSALVARGLVTRTEWVGDYVDLLVQQRSRLRAAQRWEEADLVRADLASSGITLMDTRAGTEWRFSDRGAC